MNEAEDLRPSEEAVAELAREIEQHLIQLADGGPWETIDLKEYGPDDVDELEKKYEGCTIECDEDNNPLSVRVQVNDENFKGWATYYVAVHELTRHFGGHEEGGWWYDRGTLEDYDAIRVYFDIHRNPWLQEGEKTFLNQLAYYLLRTYEEFGSSHRSSMVPRGDDYQWGVSEKIPEDWNGYQPYC